MSEDEIKELEIIVMGMTVDDLMTWANPIIHEFAEGHKAKKEAKNNRAALRGKRNT